MLGKGEWLLGIIYSSFRATNPIREISSTSLYRAAAEYRNVFGAYTKLFNYNGRVHRAQWIPFQVVEIRPQLIYRHLASARVKDMPTPFFFSL